MSTTDILESLPPEFMCALLARAVRARVSWSEVERRRLEVAVRDFIAGTRDALEAVAHRPGWVNAHRALMGELLQRRFQLAEGAAARASVEDLARDLGIEELVAAALVPPSAEIFTQSQRAVMEELEAIARAFFYGNCEGPIRPRWTTLIVGPTGVGKSHLVRMVAARLKLETLRFGATSWVPAGAKVEPQSLRVVLEKVRRGRPFVLHFEEADKFLCRASDAWSQAQLTELLMLLEGAVGEPWTDHDRAALRRNALIVATGAWQEMFEKDSLAIGFGRDRAAASRTDAFRRVRLEQKIPVELVARFGQTLLLEPLNAEDFRRMAAQLGLGAGDYDAEEGVNSGQNVRYLESCIGRRELQRVRALISNEAPTRG
jgi:energy-coupling factor transporter ATP-binding protein EcfA2